MKQFRSHKKGKEDPTIIGNRNSPRTPARPTGGRGVKIPGTMDVTGTPPDVVPTDIVAEPTEDETSGASVRTSTSTGGNSHQA